ncbi:MAG: ABC transporter permease [Alphaproteobacteria bacterium]|nr:ABC transporter permease [Alphaproteobacteria bacterium]
MSASGTVGLAVVGFWLVMTLAGPSIAPHGSGAMVGSEILAPMSREFPLGTDYLGRDMLSRILWGARYTVGLALIATLLACAMGVALGLFAAVQGGIGDAAISRVLDAFISIPSKMFALVMVAALGSSLPVLIGTVAVIYTPGCYRLARSMAVNISAMDFVTVARARGERTAFIMREEVLPNMVLPVLTDFGLRFVFVVLLLSGLSFLGVGIQPPAADWGSLVRENLEGLRDGAPAVIMPAAAIASLTIGMTLLIDNLPGRRRSTVEGH